MGIALVAPDRPMSIGTGRNALWCPLSQNASQSAATSLDALGTLAGWWDGSSLDGVRDSTGVQPTSWNLALAQVADRSPRSAPLLPFSCAGAPAPVSAPRLSGLFGGIGLPASAAGAVYPDLHPDLGFQLPAASFTASQSWTLYLVWSRPNWRQNSGKDGQPITLLTLKGTPLLQADSAGGQNFLNLLIEGQTSRLTSTLSRRHTHAVVLRYTNQQGFDVWLDSRKVVTGAAGSIASGSDPMLFLHDGSNMGAAQCWLHEAATWSNALNDNEIATLLAYASRWSCGPRRGVLFVLNGQSNAINYALQDGAAKLLAQGVAWHIGALAYNVLATTGNAASYTMQSGHGIYPADDGTYPGSFLDDPGDGSDPHTWQLGQDGQALAQAISQLSTEDRQDICALVWPWSETDSLRSYSEKAVFATAARRFLLLERAMLSATADQLPLIWWNAIPYGTAGGMQMHREVVAEAATDSTQNVWIGNPQTADSNARGSTWDQRTGIATGGDSAHRDSLDNQRFARLAAPIVARALIHGGRGDSIRTMPSELPQSGGPVITNAFRSDATTIVLAIKHDAGSDLKVPLLASSGAGFAVMDGGSSENPGPVIPAIACSRLDAAHLRLTMAQPLTNPVSSCWLYYPYGSASIGRGNAVTDNYSEMTKPPGWDIATDLGSGWSLDFPLAATAAPLQLSDTAQ